MKTLEKIFYVPGSKGIIDTVTEEGKGKYSGETLEQVQKRYPGAILWDMDGFLSYLRGLEYSGELNIVIGGSGEAEVNTRWTPEETFASLCDVSEQCGYFTTKKEWSDFRKIITIFTDAEYELIYHKNRLECIQRVYKKIQWQKEGV